MRLKEVVIFGIGSQASLVHYYLSHDSEYTVVAFSVDQSYIKESTLHGLPVVPFEEIESVYPPDQYDMFIAIGYSNLNQARQAKYVEAKAKGYSLISYICSKATTWPNLQIGDNCLILENAIIQPFVTIGNNVTVWSGAYITHHSTVEDHCYLSSQSMICGFVHVGAYCFVGANATIKHGLTIGESCLIGAGTLLLQDAAPHGAYLAEGTQRATFSSRRAENHHQDWVLVEIGTTDRSIVDGFPMQVISVPYIEQVDVMAEYYAAADVFVSTSASESFGLTICEAMSCGTPVVSFAVGGTTEVVEHGKTGLLVPFGKVEDLKKALENVLEKEQMSFRAGSLARKRVEKLFDARKMAEEYLHLYERLV